MGLDFAQEMLDDAEARQSAKLPSITSNHASIRWVQGDAMKLPFPDDSFHAATMGYGLRNVPDALQAFKVSLYSTVLHWIVGAMHCPDTSLHMLRVTLHPGLVRYSHTQHSCMTTKIKHSLQKCMLCKISINNSIVAGALQSAETWCQSCSSGLQQF